MGNENKSNGASKGGGFRQSPFRQRWSTTSTVGKEARFGWDRDDHRHLWDPLVSNESRPILRAFLGSKASVAPRLTWNRLIKLVKHVSLQLHHLTSSDLQSFSSSSPLGNLFAVSGQIHAVNDPFRGFHVNRNITQ